MLKKQSLLYGTNYSLFSALACFFASGLNKLFAKLVLASSSATFLLLLLQIPDWQSPAFATPTAQPSKACDAL